MTAPKQTDPQFKLRLPPDLLQQIKEAAASNHRTMNAEILARLAQPEAPARSHFDQCMERLENIERNIPSAPFTYCMLGVPLFVSLVALLAA